MTKRIMERAASCLDEHVYIFTADARDHFHHQLALLWVMLRVGLLWAAFASHVDYSCIAGCSLGFGHSCASNIVLSILGHCSSGRRQFCGCRSLACPGGFFAARDSAASQTGRGEGRLAVVHMCTDDPYIAVVGSTRAFLHTDGEVGVAAVWLGLLQLSQLANSLGSRAACQQRLC